MNIRENIREQKYENTKPWPTRPDRFPEAQVQREEYYKMERVIEAAFMDDLRHYVETLGVPHQYSTKLCSKAWEDGHASGLDEVVTHAELIAEIFNQEIEKIGVCDLWSGNIRKGDDNIRELYR